MYFRFARLFVVFLGVFFSIPFARSQSDAKSIYQSAEPSVFLIYINDSAGSPVALGTGFLVGPRRIVTNAHVVRDGSPVIAVGPVRIPAKVERIDETNDLALLSVDVDLTSKPLVLSAAKPETGDHIFVIGNPEGLEKTLSEGIVSNVREIDGRKLLQITSPISHGSSGGPVLNLKGEVVGVAVAMLKEGQNLNFAVPALVVTSFLSVAQANIPSYKNLLSKIAQATKEHTEDYSSDESSAFQVKSRAIGELLKQALMSNDPDDLIQLAHIAQDEDFRLSLQAAQKAQSIKSSASAQLAMAEAQEFLALISSGDQQKKGYEEAAELAQRAISSMKTPTTDAYTTLAYLREQQGKNAEALALYTKALNAPQSAWTIDRETVLRGQVRNASALKLSAQRKSYFSELVLTGKATSEEWSDEAYRLYEIDHDAPAAIKAFQTAGTLTTDGISWCRAVLYEVELSKQFADDLLSDGKKCLTKEAVTPTRDIKDLNGVLAAVNTDMANVLNTRGVYNEAMNYAREATKIAPEDPDGFDALGDAYYYGQRYNEAVSTEKEAIRLSDGKYAYMHFRLGAAYFELEQWKLAESSFETAFQEDPKSESAAYNIALCLLRQGFRLDAIQWYRRVLKINPNREDKEDILRKIEALSQ
jgi:tetratricopeptide (TPR) repeat protein